MASLKRYLSESRHRIRLSDLVEGVVERVVLATSGEGFAVDGPTPDASAVTERVRRYEAACSTLLALASVGGFWAEVDHVTLWQRALDRFSARRLSVGSVYTIWEGLKRYPAALLLYALGIGAVEANRLGFLGRLLKTPIPDDHHHEDRIAVEVLPPSLLVDGDVRTMRVLEGMNNHRLPLNDWMHKTLRPHAARIVPDDSRYTFVFDKLESSWGSATFKRLRSTAGHRPALSATGPRTRSVSWKRSKPLCRRGGTIPPSLAAGSSATRKMCAGNDWRPCGM